MLFLDTPARITTSAAPSSPMQFLNRLKVHLAYITIAHFFLQQIICAIELGGHEVCQIFVAAVNGRNGIVVIQFIGGRCDTALVEVVECAGECRGKSKQAALLLEWLYLML